MAVHRSDAGPGEAVDIDEMNHIDLFSGIGGFAYAARQVWGGEYENVLFCDNNKFCQEVIKKNFGKDSVIYGDIREITANTADTRIKRLQEWKNQIFLLTGGFPCQPFSVAGSRKGTADNRYLWPEMLRVIREFNPRWVIAENVRGLLTIEGGVVFEQVCVDLERENYQVQPFIIPAVAVNAPHRRDRVWIVANRRQQQERNEKSGSCNGAQSSKTTGQRTVEGDGFANEDCDAPDTERNGHKKRHQKTRGAERPSKQGRMLEFTRESWQRSWLEVATELCGVDDGLPCELDGFKLTKAGHRVERLRALGNAIVPQVAIEIMRAIKLTEEER